jgi:hypothetical protein
LAAELRDVRVVPRPFGDGRELIALSAGLIAALDVRDAELEDQELQGAEVVKVLLRVPRSRERAQSRGLGDDDGEVAPGEALRAEVSPAEP